MRLVGQTVWARNFSGDPDWVPATISDRVGPLSYLVTLRNGEMWQRHIAQLRVGVETPATEDSSIVSRDSDDFTPSISGGNLPPASSVFHWTTRVEFESNETMSESNLNTPNSNESATNASTSSTRTKSRRYPSCHHKPPDRL